jgi:hypothetical protein
MIVERMNDTNGLTKEEAMKCVCVKQPPEPFTA